MDMEEWGIGESRGGGRREERVSKQVRDGDGGRRVEVLARPCCA